MNIGLLFTPKVAAKSWIQYQRPFPKNLRYNCGANTICASSNIYILGFNTQIVETMMLKFSNIILNDVSLALWYVYYIE